MFRRSACPNIMVVNKPLSAAVVAAIRATRSVAVVVATISAI